jgi:hypothetical protein
MITALALVAGSSVIFTDPIFQGMAISLASGVMVSTILTLVVIPLGCIEAERSLCEVAAAGCASAGIPVPEEIVIPAAAVPVQAKTSRSSGGLLLTVWSKVAGALTMVFYAVRGLFLLLGQMFRKKAPAARPAPAAPPPAPAAAPTPSPVVGGEESSAGRRAEAMVSAGPGVTRVISPAKTTIVPPPPAVQPAAPVMEPVPEPEVVATPAKKKPSPPPAVPKGGKAAAAQAVEPEPQSQARAKVSARRGIRLKLIKPGDDSGLK